MFIILLLHSYLLNKLINGHKIFICFKKCYCVKRNRRLDENCITAAHIRWKLVAYCSLAVIQEWMKFSMKNLTTYKSESSFPKSHVIYFVISFAMSNFFFSVLPLTTEKPKSVSQKIDNKIPYLPYALEGHREELHLAPLWHSLDFSSGF